MHALAITHKGMEDITVLELEEILGTSGTSKEGAVLFSVKKEEDLVLFAYRAQSIVRVLLLLQELKVEKLDDFNALSIKKLPANAKTFAVRCIREGEHTFTTLDVEKKVGELIHNAIGMPADLKQADLNFLVYLAGQDAFMGIDMVNYDLSKREYRIFNPAHAIKSTIAYAMLRMAGIQKKETILDPFCSAGIIPIEAALFFANKSPHFYRKASFKTIPGICTEDVLVPLDKKTGETETTIHTVHPSFHAIAGAKKNAKIAGVEKNLQFSRTELDWLDTKFKEGEIKHAVTIMPSGKQEAPDAKKTYKDFFYQMEYIVDKKGVVVIAATQPELIEEWKCSFVIKEKRTIMQGMMPLQIYVLGR
ncbi:hypothetical protein HZB01_04620 [Candidatus Woesearchaeota archaeon]|nr:hypothetical protein [Candidatus Woesearchaeota archaeon]